MTPTMYLRQAPIVRPSSGPEHLQKYQQPEVTGYRLQQWWSKARFLDDDSYRRTPDFGAGEWRDVPIVEAE